MGENLTEETLDYVVREMTSPEGGSYSTQDADSEGEEGEFFAWTPAEIRAVLRDEADRFVEAYGVTGRGSFEGKNILELKGSLEERGILAEARRQLFESRENVEERYAGATGNHGRDAQQCESHQSSARFVSQIL